MHRTKTKFDRVQTGERKKEKSRMRERERERERLTHTHTQSRVYQVLVVFLMVLFDLFLRAVRLDRTENLRVFMVFAYCTHADESHGDDP